MLRGPTQRIQAVKHRRVASQDVPRDADPVTEQAFTSSQIDKQDRKSRRIARKDGQPGPSGWKHDEGDETDLIPPSDVEEYEEWKARRAEDRSRRDTSASSHTITPARTLTSRRFSSGNRSGQLSPFTRSLSRTPSTQQLSSALTHDTSPTIPLSPRSQLEDRYNGHPSDSEMEVDELEGSLAKGEVGTKSAWPSFFGSPASSSDRKGSPPRPMSPYCRNNSSQSPSYDSQASLAPLSPSRRPQTPSPITPRSALPLPQATPSPQVDLPIDGPDPLLTSPMTPHVALPRPQSLSPRENRPVAKHAPSTEPLSKSPLRSPPPILRLLSPHVNPEVNSTIDGHDPPGSTLATPSSAFTSNRLSGFPSQADSPLVEAQLGPHNTRDWRRLSPSPLKIGAGSHDSPPHQSTHDHQMASDDDELLLRSQPNGLSIRHPIFSLDKASRSKTPFVGGDRIEEVNPTDEISQIRQSSEGVTLKLTTSSHTAELAPASAIPHVMSPVPLSTAAPPAFADPALEQFRTARTFRTRTVLQLQPYTKERQIYEAALRRGGLKKGKKAIATEREITPNEEDDEVEGDPNESSEAEGGDPERIVIGDTPSLQQRRPSRKPVSLEDVDFDNYFMQYGVPVNEEDEISMEELQKIARLRLKAEKVERKERREERRMRKEFEKAIGGDIKNGHSGPSDQESDYPIPPSKRQRLPNKTPGRTKTYSKCGRDASAPRSLIRPHISQISRSPPSRARLTSIELNTDGWDREPECLNSAAAPSLPLMDNAIDISVDPANATPSFHTAADELETNTGGVHRMDSFFIDDLAQPSPPRGRSASDSESDVSLSIRDPREKIARRMMPAAMLRRLENETMLKEKRREERRRNEARPNESTPRPGRAVVRRALGNGDINDFVNLIASDVESDDSGAPMLVSLTPGRLQQQELVLVSGEESSASSQAQEDKYGGGQSLARLYDGEFETLIAGRRSIPKGNGRQRQSSDRHSRVRRPALELARQITSNRNKGSKDLLQTRLDLPADNDQRIERKKRRQKHEKLDTSRTKPASDRPAIRLEDHVIFSTADFDFGEDIPPSPPRRKFTRTVSKPVAEISQLDAGIGKAKSWANFNKFPIDFGISPLPSGIYCAPNTYVGDGRLRRLIQVIQRSDVDEPDTPSLSAYGIELQSEMSPAAIRSVVTVISEGIINSITGLVNGSRVGTPDLSPLRFLGAYLISRGKDRDGDIASLRFHCMQAVQTIAIALNQLTIVKGKKGSEVRDSVVELRLALLDLSCRISLVLDDDGKDSMALVTVADSAHGLLRQLLSIGFHKSIKPLKSLMRAEADSAQIDCQSTITWIATLHVLDSWSGVSGEPDFLLQCLDRAIENTFHLDHSGPIAAERIWFLIFGLCALSQFDVNGRVTMVFNPSPRWSLVRRAIGLIKISHNEEAEENAHIAQLRGRDRYIKAMISRCVRLSAAWNWNFDRESFSVATKDLGVIFKDRHHRNLPTESPVDYPDFISRFDMSLTAVEDTRGESAFELYLRLVCVAASDIIATAQSLSEARQAEKDVQRLIMSIIPVSSVKFNRILPPTQRQLGQLINRYSTMIAACYFSPSLLPWLLANSRKWAPFENADFESRQVAIRGLMYLAVACRHHSTSLDTVIDAFADILSTLQREVDGIGKPSAPAQAPSKVEIERTMVLVVACFRQIILHHSLDPDAQSIPTYPEPCLLHESWTSRIFALDLANDLKCGTKVVATIQTFLDARAAALPRLARQRREAREKRNESQDEFSFGLDFSIVDLAALGGEGGAIEDPVQRQEEEFANIINTVISPQIYRLLSDMLPPVEDETLSSDARAERQIFITKLTQCWSDCAGVVVVEQNSPDGWTPYVGPFGKQSWQRLRNEQGRLQVGLQFMLNVARLDPNAFSQYEEIFLTLLFQSIVTDKLTVEHKYLSALLNMPGVLDHSLFVEVAALPDIRDDLDRSRFMEIRGAVLEALFSAISPILGSSYTASGTKALIYRCVNLMVSSLISNEKSIDPNRVIYKESYHVFALNTISDLTRLAGEYITPMSVPGLKFIV